jgi:septation ring formation regulator EzrA
VSPINLALGPDGPSPDEWEAEQAIHGESTSARLRRVEQELAEARDEIHVLKNSEAAAIVHAEARQQIAEAELTSARAELAALRAANDQLRADYSAAADELERMHVHRPEGSTDA